MLLPLHRSSTSLQSPHIPFSSLLPRPPPPSTLFPYTTLFRSQRHGVAPRRSAICNLEILEEDRPGHGVDHQMVHGDQETLMPRSEEHTSELQSLRHLVCRLLLEKKKKQEYNILTKRTHKDLDC